MYFNFNISLGTYLFLFFESRMAKKVLYFTLIKYLIYFNFIISMLTYYLKSLINQYNTTLAIYFDCLAINRKEFRRITQLIFP